MKKDCFGFGESECRILTKTDCGNCSFYSSKADSDRSLEESNKRLSSLPKETQQYIAGRYYNGQMPWRKGCEVNALQT
ncbi:MAG: hypothetical protein IJ736_08885 [Firmicutes bacterium]|nr:hypothetical protein [Bacillota bacterium]